MKAPKDFPELHTAAIPCDSWICIHPSGTKEAETRTRDKALEAHSKGWTVKTLYQYNVDNPLFLNN